MYLKLERALVLNVVLSRLSFFGLFPCGSELRNDNKKAEY